MASRYSAAMWVYLNHNFVDASLAAIPIQDRGFRYGDGLFETLRIMQGVPLHFERHIKRLEGGLQAIKIPFSAAPLKESCKALLHKNAVQEGILRIAISRGAGGRGYAPAPTSTPTLLIETLPLPPQNASPLRLMTSSYRKTSAQALPVGWKLAQGLNSTLAVMEASEQGCDDAILLNEAGHICETSAANLFWRKEDMIFTPALSCGILQGTRRALLCKHWAEKLQHGAYPMQALLEADAVICTNTAHPARPIQSLLSPQKNWQSESFAREVAAILHECGNAYINMKSSEWR